MNDSIEPKTFAEWCDCMDELNYSLEETIAKAEQQVSDLKAIFRPENNIPYAKIVRQLYGETQIKVVK